MTTKKFIFTIIGLFAATFIIVVLIRINNDHKECENTCSYTKEPNGTTTVSKKHICKEKFSF